MLSAPSAYVPSCIDIKYLEEALHKEASFSVSFAINSNFNQETSKYMMCYRVYLLVSFRANTVLGFINGSYTGK